MQRWKRRKCEQEAKAWPLIRAALLANWKTVMGSVVLSLGLAGIVLAVPIIQIQLGQQTVFWMILPLISLFAALKMLSLPVGVISNQLELTAYQAVELTLKMRIWNQLKNVSQARFDQKHAGEQLNMDQLFQQLSMKSVQATTQIFGMGIVAIAYFIATELAILERFSWWVGVLILTPMVFIYLGQRKLPKVQALFEVWVDALNIVVPRFNNRFTNRKQLRAAGTLEQVTDQIGDETRLLSTLLKKGSVSRTIAVQWYQAMALFCGTAMILIVGLIVYPLPMLEVILIVSYVDMLYMTLGNFMGNVSILYEIAPYKRKLDKYLKLPEIEQGSEQVDGPIWKLIFHRAHFPYGIHQPIRKLVLGQGVNLLVGPSGSGKSTLLEAISREIELVKGSIQFITAQRVYKIKNLSLVSLHQTVFSMQQAQDGGVISGCTIGENLFGIIGGRKLSIDERFQLILHPFEWTAVQRRMAARALQMVGLRKFSLDHPVNQLSGGQQQRVAFARLLVQLLMLGEGDLASIKGKILLFDEPTGPLDGRSARRIMRIIKLLAKQNVVLLVSHRNLWSLSVWTQTVQVGDGRVKPTRLWMYHLKSIRTWIVDQVKEEE